MRKTILAASVTALLAFVSTAMMATAMATAEAAAATEAQDIAQEDSAFKLDLHRFFPQYRAVPSKLILLQHRKQVFRRCQWCFRLSV